MVRHTVCLCQSRLFRLLCGYKLDFADVECIDLDEIAVGIPFLLLCFVFVS